VAQSSRLDALPIESRWIGRRSIDKREDCSVKLLRAVVIVALLLPVTSASAAVPGFGHVFVIVGENTSYSQVTAHGLERTLAAGLAVNPLARATHAKAITTIWR
jgi:hypothetical protein